MYSLYEKMSHELTAPDLSEPKREIKDVLLLFLPILGICFSNYIFSFIEKIFLSQISAEAMEAATNVAYVSQVFQITSTALVMMAQVFVGRWYGARNFHAVGPGIWQFVWFSFLSMIITVPTSLLYGIWYFFGTEIESSSLSYLYLSTSSNFLYPLGAALSSFFLGRGKTKLILFSNLIEQGMKIGLTYLLIFGAEPWIPPQGVLGGAISSMIVQGGFCLFLGFQFLKKENQTLFSTHHWKFQPKLFWECIQPGLFRASNRILSMVTWTSTAHLMAIKGGLYLLTLSVGGSFTLFLPFLYEAIYQTETIKLSQHIGAKLHSRFRSLIQIGLVLVLGSTLLFSGPFLLLPEQTLSLLYPSLSLDSISIKYLFLGIWVWAFYVTLTAIPLSYLFAFKDTKFYFMAGAISYTFDYFVMYFIIEYIGIEANRFWLILAIVQGCTVLPIYFLRMRYLHNRHQLKVA